MKIKKPQDSPTTDANQIGAEIMNNFYTSKEFMKMT